MTRNDQNSSVGAEENLALAALSTHEESSAPKQQISPHLFTARTSTNLPPPEEKTNARGIQVQIISPSMGAKNACFMALPQGQLDILLQGAGLEKLAREAITLTYYHKGKAYGEREEVATITREIAPLLQEQEEGRCKLVLPLDFAQHNPALQEGDFLKIDFLEQPTAQIVYRPNPKLPIEDAEGLASSKAYLEKRLKYLWLDAEDAAALQEYLPELVVTKHGSGQSYVSTKLLQ